MALPKIDTPTYEVTLPLSKKHITFRPFLVKEQKNLLMAMEADDADTIQRNVKQVLTNCTITPNIEIEKLPIIDIEYYFLQLRARSISEIVENTYICTNEVNGEQCGNKMKTTLNLLDIKVEFNPDVKDLIQLTDKISIKLRYPEFSLIDKLKDKETAADIAFEIIIDSVEYIFDGEQYYYSYETPREELIQFLESLNQEQFGKLESFFDDLPKMNREIKMKCGKCGYEHDIFIEGLESFFD